MPRLDGLLYELCTDMGFCLPPSEQARLEAESPGDADALTDAIFVGEGLDPKRADQVLWRQVRARVAARFHTLIDPAIVEDIGTLLESLAKLGVQVTGARYEARTFGNYYVDCGVHGTGFRVVRDRGQYLIEAPQAQLEALGIFRAFNSRDEMGTAVRMYVLRITDPAGR